jgi:uncharacterized protein YjbJ (UPF0337 family)
MLRLAQRLASNGEQVKRVRSALSPSLHNREGTSKHFEHYTGESFPHGVIDMDKDRIAGAAKDAAGKVESVVGKATGDERTEVSGRTREAEGTVQNLYGQVKDGVRDASEAAASYAKDALDSDTYRDGTQALTDKVRDNPLGSLLIAGGIGFALAMLMSRPPRRRPNRFNY